ncbi:MAG: formate dehydrogenase accessory sulfurtransferase FdhD [Crocinitomicaceae bacterium]|nr:formate dehydrogenase accessory sulfurtransferase FdhD [Crocinitomicaceae bacterium]
MLNKLEYEGLFFKESSSKKVFDNLPVEEPLEISINGKPYTVVLQTPGDELELGLGLLYAEDVISINTSYEFDVEEQKINFIIDKSELREGYLSSRSLLSVSSCGICGKQSLEDINVKGKNISDDLIVKTEVIHALFNTLKENQYLFNETGGTHGIAVFDENATLLSIKEDVGRHNALDKSVGELIRNKNLSKAKVLLCSGRLSYEIISKSFRAKIPIVAAVSCPTSLAVDFAKEYGITLIGFSRENKLTCYANPSRLSE